MTLNELLKQRILSKMDEGVAISQIIKGRDRSKPPVSDEEKEKNFNDSLNTLAAELKAKRETQKGSIGTGASVLKGMGGSALKDRQDERMKLLKGMQDAKKQMDGDE